MVEIGKDGWLNIGSSSTEEEAVPAKDGTDPERMPIKTVMVYWMDKKNMTKEPIGILTERRKSERDNNNAIGMLRLARKEFAKTEEESQMILIGDYV
ncbi:hypothetical protein [Candidatus Deferrimicrobium sp.]|uniref:hypothetical protein n=1 Tax=Candidatus Deferrimicrobium sp. TaxID=3060586 RepID=UPI002EDABE8E